MTLATTGYQRDFGGSSWQFRLVPIDSLNESQRNTYRTYCNGRFDTETIMQMALMTSLSPSYWDTYERHQIISRVIERSGAVPGSVDFRVALHQITDFILRLMPALEEALYRNGVPFDPTIKIAGAEKDFFVVGFQANNYHETASLCRSALP